MKRVLHRSKYFSLSKVNYPNSGKRGKGKGFFSITCHWWRFTLEESQWIQKVLDANQDCKVSNNSWEYRDKVKAEKLYYMMLLRWS
jgi:hypothetical protein